MPIHHFEHTVPWPREHVWRWFTRPGAFQRLSAPWELLQPRKEATSLRDGRATLAPPVGPEWVAQHLADGYVEGQRFEDLCVSQPWRTLTRWRHAHRFDDVDASQGVNGTLVRDDVMTSLPRSALAPMFGYRHRQLHDDLAAHDRLVQWIRSAGFGERARTAQLTFAVTGSSGLVGNALTAFLTTGGHRVIRLTRGQATGPDERHWNPDDPHPDLLEGADVLIHLAGEPIGSRFTGEHVQAVRDSRVGPTRRLAELVAAPRGQVRALVCASAVGFYGPDRGDELLTETSDPGEGVLADICAEWEGACQPAADAGVRVVNVRTGVVVSGRGGVAGLLRPVFLAGLGGRLGSGEQWMSWIGLDDLVDVYARASVDPTLRGPINAVAPHPVPNAEFTQHMAAAVHRPALVPVPPWAPAAVLGTDGARELALADQRVLPRVLEQLDHPWRRATIDHTLEHELGGFPLLTPAATTPQPFATSR